MFCRRFSYDLIFSFHFAVVSSIGIYAWLHVWINNRFSQSQLCLIRVHVFQQFVQFFSRNFVRFEFALNLLNINLAWILWNLQLQSAIVIELNRFVALKKNAWSEEYLKFIPVFNWFSAFFQKFLAKSLRLQGKKETVSIISTRKCDSSTIKLYDQFNLCIFEV